MFNWSLTSLTFSSDKTVEIEPGEVLILIGPNGAGKSRALFEIDQALVAGGRMRDAKVVTALGHRAVGTEEELRAWLKSNFQTTQEGGLVHNGIDGAINVRTPLTSDYNLLLEGHTAAFAAFFARRLDAANRLGLIGPPRTQGIDDPPAHFIHRLQADEELHGSISAQVRDAFGVDLIIQWRGVTVDLHVGDDPPRDNGNRVSPPYAAAVERLPLLTQEGDGIKSFVGTLLAVHCGAHPLMLIDEPEVFLHPPQTYRLGRLITEAARDHTRQFIVSSHSSDFIQGALSVANSRVSVCRLRRVGDANSADALSSEDLRDVVRVPLLRSASAIDGVFHDGVVVTEGGSDARFYEAVMRVANSDLGDRRPDIYFVEGGGKGALPTLARATGGWPRHAW